jgi:isoquinoline 1-oxidoreductase alpha subunit
MARYSLVINRQRREVAADPDMPLLWVLRDRLRLTGT